MPVYQELEPYDFGPNVETHVRNTLSRNGVSLKQAHNMSDRDLLALTGLGRTGLRWIRALDRSGRPRCPACGQRIR